MAHHGLCAAQNLGDPAIFPIAMETKAGALRWETSGACVLCWSPCRTLFQAGIWEVLRCPDGARSRHDLEGATMGLTSYRSDLVSLLANRDCPESCFLPSLFVFTQG